MKRIIQKIHVALAALSESQWLLFSFTFFLNALVLPYKGIEHDARLYGFQVLNRLMLGHFSDDLFFKFGSQDQYSIFSWLVLPLAKVLEIENCFFLLYITFKAFLIFAFTRFLFCLVDFGVVNKLVAVVSTLVFAINPIFYGGFEVFAVNESFLTPRLIACGLVLFAFERILRGKWLVAIGCLVLGMLLHPLMAVGGVVVTLLFAVTRYVELEFGQRVFNYFLISSVSLFFAICLYQPLGAKLFGLIQGDWKFIVLHRTPYNYVSMWNLDPDWVRICCVFLVVGLWFLQKRASLAPLSNYSEVALVPGCPKSASWSLWSAGILPAKWLVSLARCFAGRMPALHKGLGTPLHCCEHVEQVEGVLPMCDSSEDCNSTNTQMLLSCIFITAICGLSLSTIADFYDYAFLLQGQPYRTLWILNLILIPLGLNLAYNLWQKSTSLSKSLALILAYSIASFFTFSLESAYPLLICIPFLFVFFHGIRLVPRKEFWLWLTLATSFMVGTVIIFFKLLFGLVVSFGEVNQSITYSAIPRMVFNEIDKISLILIGLVLLGIISKFSRKKISLLSLFTTIAIQLLYFHFLGGSRIQIIQDRTELEQVKKLLLDKGDLGKKGVVVYWPWHAWETWRYLNVDSYFQFEQLAGVVFSRDLSVEGLSRASLVARCELQAKKLNDLSRKVRDLYQKLFIQKDFDSKNEICELTKANYIVLQKVAEHEDRKDLDALNLLTCK